MHTQEQMDGFVGKWKQCTVREKAEMIAVFLNECGEHTINPYVNQRTFDH